MESKITGGNEPLGRAGLIALTRCGHWWVYPVRGTPKVMHDLASFNLGLACSFCIADFQAAIRPQARGVMGRVN